MSVKLFRGKDRRMLLKAQRLLIALQERDQVARTPKPSSRISTRSRVFPLGNPELETSLDNVVSQIDWCLASTRDNDQRIYKEVNDAS